MTGCGSCPAATRGLLIERNHNSRQRTNTCARAGSVRNSGFTVSSTLSPVGISNNLQTANIKLTTKSERQEIITEDTAARKVTFARHQDPFNANIRHWSDHSLLVMMFHKMNCCVIKINQSSGMNITRNIFLLSRYEFTKYIRKATTVFY